MLSNINKRLTEKKDEGEKHKTNPEYIQASDKYSASQKDRITMLLSRTFFWVNIK